MRFVNLIPAVACALSIATPLQAEAGPLAALAAVPTIQAELARSYCAGTQAFDVVNIHVNPADVGLPGLVYVATSDPAEQQANYTMLGSPSWYAYQGEAMFVPYAVVSGGLQDAALTIPAGAFGWKLWVGYGALTAKAANALIASATAQANAAAIGRTLPAVDPDHMRRAFIQEDMRQNGKYIAVLDWSRANVPDCNPNSY